MEDLLWRLKGVVGGVGGPIDLEVVIEPRGELMAVMGGGLLLGGTAWICCKGRRVGLWSVVSGVSMCVWVPVEGDEMGDDSDMIAHLTGLLHISTRSCIEIGLRWQNDCKCVSA